MAKKVLVLTLIILLGLSVGVFGGKKPVDEKMRQRLEKIEEGNYGEISLPPPYGYSDRLNKTLIPGLFISPNVAGYTYYDFQHNNVQRRMIANGADANNTIHVTWMDLPSPPIDEERFTDYNSYASGSWLAAGGEHVTPDEQRGGYSSLDLLPDQREVLCYHRTKPTPNLFWGTTISIETGDPGNGTFASYDIPDSVQGKGQDIKGEWPIVACAKVTGAHNYIHITHAEGQTSGSVDLQMYYVRCYEGGSGTLKCESPGWGSTLTINNATKLAPNKVCYNYATCRLGAGLLATSPVSQKVAIVYLKNYAPTQSQNELMYIESTNNGEDWMTAGNMGTPVQLTNYQAGGAVDRAYADLAAIYDYDDNLHIVWTTFNKDDANDVTLWHWTASQGIRQVDNVTASSAVDPGAWNLLISKLTLGLYHPQPDTNILYLTYTKFIDGDISAGGFANGDICVKGSTNFGFTWGPEVNLTNTNSNGCTSGNCKSEQWSSLAERVDNFLHIQYVHDLDPGGSPQGEGTIQNDSIVYLKYSRPPVPAIALRRFDPVQMYRPIRWAVNNGYVHDSMIFKNIGTSHLFVRISGPTWATINPSNFIILEGGPDTVVNLTFSGVGFSDTLLVDSLKIESNHESSGENYSHIDWVKIHFVVSDTFYYATWDTVRQGDVKVAVSNAGNLGHGEEESGWGLNYKNHDYVFDCTPVFVTPDFYGAGPASFTYLHDRKDFIPLWPTAEEKFPNLGVIVVYDLFGLHPSRLPFPYHWYWSWLTHESRTVIYHDGGRVYTQLYCSFQVSPEYGIPKWWPYVSGAPTSAPAGYFGIAADFDVPGEAAYRDLGEYDTSLNLIWLNCDTAEFTNYFGGFMFLGARVLKQNEPDSLLDSVRVNYPKPYGAHVLNNVEQLYPWRGYQDDSLIKYISTSGWSVASDSAQDMNILMSFNPTPIQLLYPDPYELEYEFAIVVTDEGPEDLRQQAHLIRKIKAGDANRDGKVSVSDVVYLINYLFKGGPVPLVAYSDANGDGKISVSDVVYLINYCFKGGPAPILIWMHPEPWER